MKGIAHHSEPYAIASLSSGELRLPVKEITGIKPGPTVTITAGMDGDEYAGIETAYILEKRYAPRSICGCIQILPLINVAGYKQGVSKSPVDNKYPKFVFPGAARGTHTDELMHWLWQSYIKTSDLWIDLHGGSSTEQLHPFVWIYQSKHVHIQDFHRRFIETTSARVVVNDRQSFMRYSSFLDAHRIGHILMECGDLGTKRKKDIDTLCAWVDEALATEGTIRPVQKSHRPPTIYTSVRYCFTPSDTQIGQGHLLWKSVDPSHKKGDVLAAYALE